MERGGAGLDYLTFSHWDQLSHLSLRQILFGQPHTGTQHSNIISQLNVNYNTDWSSAGKYF